MSDLVVIELVRAGPYVLATLVGIVVTRNAAAALLKSHEVVAAALVKHNADTAAALIEYHKSTAAAMALQAEAVREAAIAAAELARQNTELLQLGNSLRGPG